MAGSGNVATRLLHAFVESRIFPDFLFSTSESGAHLAAEFKVPLVREIEQIPKVDILLLCWQDKAIEELDYSRFSQDILLCHTAGSLSIEVFGARKRAGVFYPLQTLSKEKEVNFSTVPLCLEAKEEEDLQKLQLLAKTISEDIRILNSDQRKQAHMAAVFVSNFVNYCYKIGYDLLQEKNLDFSLIQPLIQETAEKVMHLDPTEAQTGPARRADKNVISKHLRHLENWPNYQKIYQLISQSIENEYKR